MEGNGMLKKALFLYSEDLTNYYFRNSVHNL